MVLFTEEVSVVGVKDSGFCTLGIIRMLLGYIASVQYIQSIHMSNKDFFCLVMAGVLKKYLVSF